ncbi:dihydrolipoamide acetyltransferase family protein [Microbacterium oxydans]|uniref:dihydrolipoamide acetyltransferase family protein n=1 Tax=Microbacterium oxydans TaxID=82380 RepID=UPI00366D3A2F
MIDILMPRLSDTMTEGAVAAWHKKPGDAVAVGDLLLEVETDKALMEQEAYDAGVLAEILVPEGESVAIGTPIARLDDGSGTATQPSTSASAPPSAPPPTTTQPTTPLPTAPEPPRATDRVAATPLVRRIAREQAIDLSTVVGTGPGGRIVRADLAGTAAPAAAAPPTSPPTVVEEGRTEVIPFDVVRKTIATRMSEAAAVPTFTVTSSARVDEFLALRARINESPATGVRVSVNDLLLKAVASALRAHPEINASYSPSGGGATILHRDVHIGVAMAAPSGLVVPVVQSADAATITSIAARVRDLSDRAAVRRLSPAELTGGTFTVSNLGMFGVDHFTAIINPPQGAILAVGGISDDLVLTDGLVTSRRRISYTLTADHRIIDGADGARFLATITRLLEEPLQLLL